MLKLLALGHTAAEVAEQLSLTVGDAAGTSAPARPAAVVSVTDADDERAATRNARLTQFAHLRQRAVTSVAVQGAISHLPSRPR